MWRAPVAGGYAGAAVAGGKVFVTDFVPSGVLPGDNFERKTASGSERVLCLDEATGKEIWKHEIPVTYTISYPAGPRCTPTVDGDHVYTLGGEGNLLCLAVADGRVVWAKDLKKEYETKAALWGWAGHPLVDGDRLFVIAGTAKAHVVAAPQAHRRGAVARRHRPRAGLLSADDHRGGRRAAVGAHEARWDVCGVARLWRVLWETPYNADNGSIIMAPVKVGEHLYVGGFQEKNLLVKLAADKPGVEVVWRNKAKHGISAVNVQPIVDGTMLYGFHEKGDLRGIEIPGGAVKWSSPGPFGDRAPPSATAFITRHGNRYFLFAETGDLVIARLSSAGYEARPHPSP